MPNLTSQFVLAQSPNKLTGSDYVRHWTFVVLFIKFKINRLQGWKQSDVN